jgi:DNA invertase Pin-like site-specific DNA recombinase
MGELIGYARVSTAEQNEARQVKAFEDNKVDKVFIDKLSGKDTNRPQLKEMLGYVRAGDTVIVTELARLGRSTSDLLHIVDELTAKGVEFRSLKENIDTTTPTGKFTLTIFAALAELERNTILQRQREGIAIAKSEGKYKGRQKIPLDEKKFKAECKKWVAGEQTAAETMRKFDMKSGRFYRRAKEFGFNAPNNFPRQKGERSE